MHIVPDAEQTLKFSQEFWASIGFTVGLVELSESVMDIVVLIELVKSLQ